MKIIGRIFSDLRLHLLGCLLLCLGVFFLIGCQGAVNTLEPIAVELTQLPLLPIESPTVMPTAVPTQISTATLILPTETADSPTAVSPSVTPTLLPTFTPLSTNTPELIPVTDTPLPIETVVPTPTDTPFPSPTPLPLPTETPTVAIFPTETESETLPVIVTPTLTPTIESIVEITSTVTPTPIESAVSCASISDISLEECDALATMARFWSAQPHFWFENNQACSWFGITCEEGHVVGIALNHDGVEVTTGGELTPEAFSVSLPYLRQLSLIGGFSGVIPPQIGRLTTLTDLTIYSPQLMGNIPAEIGNLTNLRSLSLGGLSSHYGQQYACPCGKLPPEIGRLTQLNVLAINLTGLDGSLPAEIGNLTALTTLDLSWNSYLVGELPATVANLTQLERLNYDRGCLYSPDGDVAVTEWLARVDQSKESYCSIYLPSTPTPEPTDELFITPTLTPATFCESVASLPVSECTALQTVMQESDASFVPQGEPCQWLGITCEEGHVIAIDWSNTSHLGTLSEAIGNLEYLETISVGGVGLTGSLPKSIGRLSHLISLIGGSNQFSGTLPDEWSNLSRLETLWLGGNQFSGTFPPSWGNMANLVSLGLADNQLSGSLPPELGRLTALQHLWVANNQFSGDLPMELGRLPQLFELDIRNNQLTGTVPPELFNLPLFFWDGNLFIELTAESSPAAITLTESIFP